MLPGEIHVDPVHDEFFKAQDLPDALVREVIQNSLDARRGSSRVRVRFRFVHGSHALPSSEARKYLGGLREHLEPIAGDLPEGLPSSEEPVPWLLIEDAGTRGLSGRPDVDPELTRDESSKNDFYFFWRNIGRTVKGELDRGRWGLGKAVFPIASRIRTIFGLTTRAEDGRRLLLGQSVLKTHVHDGHRCDPYGFFGVRRRDDFMLPIEEPELVEQFIRDFGLQRTEPGLSVVVPWYRQEDLPFEAIAAAVLRQYFYPVIRGDLVVHLEDEARSETIDAQSIEAVAARVLPGADSIDRLSALTRWAVTQGTTSLEMLEPQAADRAPKWGPEVIGERRLRSLRERLESGERLAIRVPVAVKRLRSRAASTHFDIFMEKDESVSRGEHHHLRRGITIPDIRTPRDKPIRALLVVDDEKLSTLLGDAENPAHSDWSERADRVRTHYDHGAWTVRFVKNAIPSIASILLLPPGGRVRDFLRDFFALEIDGSEEQKGGAGTQAGRDRGGEVIAETPEPVESRSSIELRQISGGFVFEGERGRVGRQMRAELAYRTPTGNPFRKYDSLDFDLANGGIEVEAEGAEIVRREGNVVELRTTAEQFHLACSGFDPRRDLVVRVTESES